MLPTRLIAAETSDAASADESIRRARRRLNRIFFLATVLAAQLTWLGVWAYATFRLLL